MSPVTLTRDPTAEELEDFKREYADAQDREQRTPVTIQGQKVVWAPQRGYQEDFMSFNGWELLGHGTRGGGKSDCLLMAFAMYTGRGWGLNWRGIIFRQTYKQLADLVAKSMKWFPRMFPGIRFNWQRMEWRWPDGEVLYFGHVAHKNDYLNYHGHEFTFMGFDELTNWATEDLYKNLISLVRSTIPEIPLMIRAITNPYGPGYQWVKDRFDLAGKWWKTVIQNVPRRTSADPVRHRVALHSHLRENKLLQPGYESTIAEAVTSDAQREAWLEGSWDITFGGMFDDCWTSHNLVPDFVVPAGGRLDRSFDWGSSAPFAVDWWYESNGLDIRTRGGSIMSTVRGDLFLMRSWYGWNGKPNEGLRYTAREIAEGIVERQILYGWQGDNFNQVKAGPADTQIWQWVNGSCIATDMAKPVRIGEKLYKGVTWTKADKRQGTRVAGWEKMRILMKNAQPLPDRPREQPGLFVVDGYNDHFLRTVVTLARSEKNPDDTHEEAEDHEADSVRYRCLAHGGGTISRGRARGTA